MKSEVDLLIEELEAEGKLTSLEVLEKEKKEDEFFAEQAERDKVNLFELTRL